MPDPFADLIRAWDGLAVVTRYDRDSECWFFVALHDDTLGAPTGGCRMRVYPRPEDGLLDVLRLARGMTLKFAGAGLRMGGGKSVIALSRPLEAEERREALRRFGRLLESLRGAYWTGEDMGTTPEDMVLLAQETRFVHGVERAGGSAVPSEAVDPGPYTARGVLAGLRAVASQLFGSPDLRDRSVLVQGVGDVGEPLVGLLTAAGARVLVSDTDAARVERVGKASGAQVIPPEGVYATPCDLFAPCAVGAILNRETIPRLACRGVAGSANNQLADEAADGARLHERGIVYAPDFLVNAGGAIALILLRQGIGEEEIRRRIEGIEATISEVLEKAARRAQPPQATAEEEVLALLREARNGE
jgi:leucine dehydrogenase